MSGPRHIIIIIVLLSSRSESKELRAETELVGNLAPTCSTAPPN